jgi:hypothetical protein
MDVFSWKKEPMMVFGIFPAAQSNSMKKPKTPRSESSLKKRISRPVLRFLLGVYSGPLTYYRYANGDVVSGVDTVYLCEDYEGEIAPQVEEGQALGLV